MKFFTCISLGFLVLISINIAVGRPNNGITQFTNTVRQAIQSSEESVNSLPAKLELPPVDLDLDKMPNQGFKGKLSLSDVVITGLDTAKLNSNITTDNIKVINYRSVFKLSHLTISGRYNGKLAKNSDELEGSGNFKIKISNLRSSTATKLAVNSQADNLQISDTVITFDFSTLSVRADGLKLNGELIPWKMINKDINANARNINQIIKQEIIPAIEVEANKALAEIKWSEISNAL